MPKGEGGRMKLVGMFALAAIVLLSLAAGGAKISQMPQEAAFFTDAGIDQAWMVSLGLIQVAGAIAAAFARTRRLGLFVTAAAFLISSLMIFVTGNLKFGVISVLPVAVCIILLMWLPRADKQG
jgi:hypothetical protein